MYDQLPDFLKIVLGLACLALLIAGLVALWRRTPDPDDQDDF
jgi:succinate dehydrogenase hydrophobic anchor subunit